MSCGFLDTKFSLAGRSALVAGGTGVLGSAIARALACAGARVAVLGRRAGPAEDVVSAIRAEGGTALALTADVLRRESLERARKELLEAFGGLDILVNAAGGNRPPATTADERPFFDIDDAALREVIDLNLMGTVLCCQVFGEVMAERSAGSIVNISSMAASRPLTRVVGYGAAKAGVENLTRWLAVELARRYGAGLRVNAIAPGFFIAEQNRRLLLGEDGRPTERGERVLEHTPAARFGEPEDVVGTVIWLCSDAAAFVNGVVVAVDGGFSAYAGV